MKISFLQSQDLLECRMLHILTLLLPLVGNANFSQGSQFNPTDVQGQVFFGTVLHGQYNSLFINRTVHSVFQRVHDQQLISPHLQYCYIVNQTDDANKEIHHLEDIVLTHHQLLVSERTFKLPFALRGNGRSPVNAVMTDVYEGQPLQTSSCAHAVKQFLQKLLCSLFLLDNLSGLLMTSLNIPSSFPFSQMYSLSSRSAGSSAKVFLVNGIPG